jgi:amino acid transporter
MTADGLGLTEAASIALSALFSTGGGINATLFSAAHFADGMLDDGLLPEDIGDADGIPARTLLVLGVVTAAFSAPGSLGAITSFASLAFIVVFGAMSLLCLRERDHDLVHPLPPAVGLLGTSAFLPLMAYNLHDREPRTFAMVLVVAAVVVSVELLYFEREVLKSTVVPIEEERVEDAVEEVTDRVAGTE